jgi:SAM-dependent methyltransferase
MERQQPRRAQLFNLPFLHTLREEELEEVIRDFPPRARILDFGAGTGHQTNMLRSKGFEVVAVDLPDSDYSDERVVEITEYDGKHIPLPDQSVDVIFSSNVLEHVEDLHAVFAEFARILKPGGIEIHLMPTAAWRFWTFAAGVPTAAIATANFFRDLCRPLPAGTRRSTLAGHVRTAAGGILPIGHGTSSEGLSELWTFSPRAWKARFRRFGHEVVHDRPLGLFYTGHLLLADRLNITRRRGLSRSLGSAVHLYRVKPVRRNPIGE